jgi:hypothetical protein
VPLSWDATTVATGESVTGYVVNRYDSSNVLQPGASCSGIPTTPSCTEATLPNGTWTYGVQAKFHKWLGPESSRITVQVDTTAPTISAHPSSSSADANPSFSFSHATFTSFKCKIDGGAFTACSSPKSYSSLADGSHTFTVEAVDAANFATPTASFTWTVDTTTPTISAKPAATSANAGPSFSFGHTAYSTFECKLDGAGFTACGTPKSYSSLGDGSHTFQVRAKGADGVATTAASYTWSVDTSPAVITAKPAATSANAAPSFSFNHGSYSTLECSLDGAVFTSCTSPKSYASVADGSHTFRVRAKDGDGVATPVTAYTWTVNTGAPTITAKPSSTSANSSPSFSFTHPAGAYTFKCQLDGGGLTACTSPKSYSSLADGSHTFQVEAVDADGVATAVASFTWTVSTAAPTITAKPSSPSANSSPSFSFIHPAGAYTFKCQLDGGGLSACTSPKSYSSLADGSHTFQVEAVDADGVVTPARTYTWTINTSAPTLTAQPGNPTNQTSATFTFTDAPYSLFTCKLDAGAPAACNTGTVTYSGPLSTGSHTFTVSASDADGTQTQARSSTWTIDTTAPVLQTLQMFDNDHNGKVDHVVATFNKTLGSCTAPCTSGWTLSNVPSAGTLGSVTVSGTTATLNLTEGAGAANTAVGSFTVALANTSGVVDAAGNHASFAAQAPADKAPPVPIAVALANGNGTMAATDTASITYSEPLAVASICSTWAGDASNQTLAGNGNVVVTVSDNGVANDSLSSVTTSAACGTGGTVHFGVIDLGSTGWLSATRTFSGNGGNKSQVDWTVATSTLKVTLGSPSGAVGTVAGSVNATYTPDAAITDPAGNVATGSVTAATKF